MPATQRLTALLSLGYLPSELPSVFTSTDFGVHANGIIEEWRTASVFSTKTSTVKKKHLSGSYTYQLADTEAEVISKPKRGYERRNLHLTHPIPQALLAYEICHHWPKIATWLIRQEFSLDEIVISEKYNRAIKGINFPLHRAKKDYIEATADWLVRTDITRFYPSIYTHSIPWAAYGKDTVKRNLARYRGSLADRLDFLIRNCNRNQTVGIPIGPETSRILAEIISSRLDADFMRFGLDIAKERVDRLQDDWFAGVDTLEAAEKVISCLVAIYRHYGLEINGSKTSIEHIYTTGEEPWLTEVRAFLSHNRSGTLKGERLKQFLRLGLRLQSDYPSEPVVSYVSAVVEGLPISRKDVGALESFLLKAAVVAPPAIDKICRILINVDRNAGGLSHGRIVERFTKLAIKNLERGNTFEAIWAIYTIRGLRQTLKSKRLIEMVEKMEGAVIPLILMDMKSRKWLPYHLPTKYWESLIDGERIRGDWTWLLAYEGFRKNWLSDTHGLLAEPFLKAMHDRNVVFYDPRRNVLKSKKASIIKWSKRKNDDAEVLKFLLWIRGVSA